MKRYRLFLSGFLAHSVQRVVFIFWYIFCFIGLSLSCFQNVLPQKLLTLQNRPQSGTPCFTMLGNELNVGRQVGVRRRCRSNVVVVGLAVSSWSRCAVQWVVTTTISICRCWRVDNDWLHTQWPADIVFHSFIYLHAHAYLYRSLLGVQHLNITSVKWYVR